MIKHRFHNDYSEGAHPALLKLISESNLMQEDGYGNDRLTGKARDLIRQVIESPDSGIHLVSGGTQANLIVMAAMLKPHESVIAAESAHIHIHEAGAIEATGHKINTVPSDDGKITAHEIQMVLDDHTDEHRVKPGAVFLSNSTELGTVYSAGDLESISRVCRSHGLYLYMDGARLGSAMMSSASDMRFSDLHRCTDVFSLGGTKNGALMGEALVINAPDLDKDFRYHLKQRGALLAKGRLLGAQFVGLFETGLYFTLAKQANTLAEKMAHHFSNLGYSFLAPPSTNQIFPILPNAVIARLQEMYGFYVWKKMNQTTSAIRLVTSWATREEAVDAFLADVQDLTP